MYTDDSFMSCFTHRLAGNFAVVTGVTYVKGMGISIRLKYTGIFFKKKLYQRIYILQYFQ